MSEACLFYRKLLQLRDETDNIKIIWKTDNSCLYDSVHSSTQILGKRLRIEMAILREMMDRKEIAEIPWIPTDEQSEFKIITLCLCHILPGVKGLGEYLYSSWVRQHCRGQLLCRWWRVLNGGHSKSNTSKLFPQKIPQIQRAQ